MRRTLAMFAAALVLAAGANATAEPAAPAPTWHRVRPGQVLGEIAHRYGLTVADLCRANDISKSDLIRPGQRLRIPERVSSTGATEGRKSESSKKRSEAIYRAPPGASWAPYVKPARKRGYVTIAGHGRSWSGYVHGPNDRILPRARERFGWVLASWRTGKQVPVDERLIHLVAKVSDVFGGRTIRIVSGYRERSHARNSRHKTGSAIDFSIPGVPNEALRDYLRTLPDTGVGYYPRSTHVHLDVREGRSYWVDYSRPGQRPRYGRPPPRAAQRSAPPYKARDVESADDEASDTDSPAESERERSVVAPAVARFTR